jgi:glycosyltransferase AglI
MEPLISIIIPVYNDTEGLRDTLNSLVRQKYDKSLYEIIVTDNGSTDDTTNIAKDFINKYPGLVKLVIEDKIQSSYAARNKGIVNSKGDIIAFIDADMTVEDDWLPKISNFMSDKNIKYVGFNVKILLNNKSIIGLFNKETGFKMEKEFYRNHYAGAGCLSIKREIANCIGLFDSRLVSSGDWEFGMRVWKAGYKQLFAKDIIMYHPARDTLRRFLKKFFRIGRGRYQLKYFYPDSELSRRQISLKNFFIIPIRLLRKLKAKIKKYNSLTYAIVFSFIDLLRRYAILFGYYYEKHKSRNSYL